MTVVELRPLSLGELLDRIFTHYRQHVGLFAGIMALPAVAGLGIVLINPQQQNPVEAFRVATGSPSAGSPPVLGPDVFLWILLFTAMYWLLFSVALAASAIAVSDVQLGRPATIAGSYRRVRGKIIRLAVMMVAMILAVFGAVFVGALVAMIPAIAIGVLFAAASGVAAAIVGMLAGLLGVVAGFGLALWAMAGMGVALPALALEDLSISKAFERSWNLTKGYRRRIILIFALALVLMYVAAFVFQGPFWVAMALVGENSAVMPTLGYLASLSGLLGQALISPLGMIGVVLVYFDLRVRKEGLDLKLMMESLQPGAAPPAAS